jgi:multiple sugar transport system substrate-binding protein
MAGRLLALALSLALAGCSGTAHSPQETVEVSLVVFGAPEELRAYRDLASAFERTRPAVAVRLVEASDRRDLLARLATSFAGGTPPDLFLLNYRYYAQFAVRGVLEPVESRATASSRFALADFYPQALDAFRYDGRLVCLPQNISSLVVYYNRALFTQAGVPLPVAGWTWDDLVAAAKRLTTGGRHGLGVDPEVIRVAPFVWSHGGELVDGPGFALRSPPAVAALQKFFDLNAVHHVVPSAVEVQAEDLESRFVNGRLAMVLSSRRSTPTFRTITAFDWDVAVLPRHQQAVSVLHSDAYCMTAASPHKDAAWRFLEFAVGAEGQRITAATGRTVPSLIEVSTSDEFLDPAAKPAGSRVFVDSIPSIRQLPAISTWPEIEDRTNMLLEQGFYGGQSAAAVAERIVSETAPMFARATD